MPASAIRSPAVAGLFYPGEPAPLRAMLAQMLAENPAEGPPPKALIAPHAGYLYSGPVAARAYNLLGSAAGKIRRVLLLGPAHRVGFAGLALPQAERFRTPLGEVVLDVESAEALRALPQVTVNEAAHRLEHSLEVHLPFLQALLPEFRLLPLVVGWVEPGEVAEVLERAWDGAETLVVVSSDLSHYLRYEAARARDAETARRIEALQPRLVGEQACGAYPINGLLEVAHNRALRVTRLDLRNSGDTAGDRERVVGYGAWAFYES